MTNREYWPGTRIRRSTTNGFTRGFNDEPVNWRPLQRSADIRAASTKKVDQAREDGTDRSTVHGMSKKSDHILSARRKYSPMVEGREAGQAASEKRRRASKADI